MKILVLGGTAWLGREVAAWALAEGHDVVCVARGTSGAAAAGARLVTADRDLDDALAPLSGQSWDAVVDVARQPGQVRRAVRDLAAVPHYVFVSTINVYADHATVGLEESADRLAPLAADVMESPAQYGEAKVGCEDAVLDAFGERATIARAGLIGGPGDSSGRTGYWPHRFHRASRTGSAVLAPDAKEQATSVIDVRDLAAWLVSCATGRVGGCFNATGSVAPLGGHLEACRQVSEHAAGGQAGETCWVDPRWLRDRGVQEWTGPRSLPLWLPEDEQGFPSHSNARARAAGLTLRPLESTLADTLAWRLGDPGRAFAAGLTDAEESDLLDAWSSAQGA